MHSSQIPGSFLAQHQHLCPQLNLTVAQLSFNHNFPPSSPPPHPIPSHPPLPSPPCLLPSPSPSPPPSASFHQLCHCPLLSHPSPSISYPQPPCSNAPSQCDTLSLLPYLPHYQYFRSHCYTYICCLMCMTQFSGCYWGAHSKQVGITWPLELPLLSGGEGGLTWLL